MCLGIPGRIVEFVDGTDQLATADVLGADRQVNVGLVRDEGVKEGDWVLLHLGFAMSILNEDEAAAALEGLRLMGQDYQAAGGEAPS